MYDDLDGPQGGYVFIVTYGRSGSTLLQNLLNSLPGYCIRGENNNVLMHLARAWEAVETSEPMKGMRLKGEVSGPSHPWFGAENVGPDDFGRGLANQFVRDVLQPDPGTRVAGLKEIRFHIDPRGFETCLDFIHRFFPRARFLFNTRNHGPVTRSGWWADQPPGEVFKVLQAAEKLYGDYIWKYPERCCRVHYDDYVQDAGALEEMFTFLDEPFDPDLVERVKGQRLDHMKEG